MWTAILVFWLCTYGAATHYYAVKQGGGGKGRVAAYVIFFLTAFFGYMAGKE